MDKLKERVEREVKPRPRGGKAPLWVFLVALFLFLALLTAGIFLYFTLI